jgi:exopolysaccharide biosynthesis polyprenyl glycosylphosphotransferase
MGGHRGAAAMLHVLRHYLPARKALLLFSETALLSAVVAVGMSAHLIDPSAEVLARVTQADLGPDHALKRCLMSAVLVAALAQVAIAFNELYDFRISTSRFDRSSRFVASAGSALLLVLAAVSLARLWHLDRVLDFPGTTTSQLVQTLVFTLLIAFGLLYAWRSLFHFALRRWNFNERVLVIGTGQSARELAHEMAERSEAGYEPVGLLPMPAPPSAPERGERRQRSLAPARALSGAQAEQSAAALEAATRALVLAPVAPEPEPGAEPGNGNGHKLAERKGLLELVRELGVDRVVVALEDSRGQLPIEELLRCRLAGVRIQEREELYEHITGKIAVEAMRPSYLIFNRGFQRSAQGAAGKRLLDFALSAFGLLVSWPLLAVLAVIVRWTSSGPALFTQERVGAEGRPFTLYKFRSMFTDAESRTGPVWASTDDPRVTRFGRFLRRTRLDELPQLFNVLVGDMSLVGPRPERPVFVEDLARQIPYFHLRHVVKPGVTGWAQINYPYGKSVADALQKLQYDLFYIKNQSLLFDLSILFTTIKIVVLRKGT